MVDSPILYYEYKYGMDRHELQKLISPNLFSKFPYILCSLEKKDYSEFDHIVYNVGNNPHYHTFIYHMQWAYPGLVILHDYILYYLTIGAYKESTEFDKKMNYLGGEPLTSLLKDLKSKNIDYLHYDKPENFPLNQEVLLSQNKIMVHSNYTRKKILNQIGEEHSHRIRKINQIDSTREPIKSINHLDLLKKYSVPAEHIIVSSFGHIHSSKLNHLVVEAVLELNRLGHKVVYLLCGEGDYLNDKVDSKIIFKTGYIDIDEFSALIECSDIIVNLRSVSMGETSASLIRTMGQAKPCLISNDAWFAEIPDEAAIKINNAKAKDEIMASLLKLINDPEYRTKLGKNAQDYAVAEFNPHTIAKQIADYILES